MPHSHETHPALPSNLLPVLERPGALPHRELIPEVLAVSLARETLTGLDPVTATDLDELALDFDAALEQALANLRERSDRRAWQDVDTVPGMQFYLPGTTDASARALILPDLVAPWPLEGVLFAVPSPNQLLAVPLHSFENLDALRVLVTATGFAAESASRPLSDQVFWYDGERFRQLEVRHDGESVDIIPPPEFMAVMERMATMSMVAATAEA